MCHSSLAPIAYLKQKFLGSKQRGLSVAETALGTPSFQTLFVVALIATTIVVDTKNFSSPNVTLVVTALMKTM